jgi:hypothetical protein
VNRTRFAFVVGTAMWPPVLAGTGTRQLDGVDAPGDVKGQAVLGIWWVVGPDGKKIATQVSDSSNNGY